MSVVLVVDDDPALSRALVITLRGHGYDVAVAPDGMTALADAADLDPALVILDLGLPDMDGIEVLHGIRGRSRVPIIVLSARSTSQEKLRALDAGADDYVTKPFTTTELLATVRAAVRSATPATEGATRLVVTADFTIDLDDRRVRRQGAQVRLTPTEWLLVEILVRNAGTLIPGRKLLTDVWGSDRGNESHYLRVYLAQIRRKLEPDPSRPKYFITEHGLGYRFQAILPTTSKPI